MAVETALLVAAVVILAVVVWYASLKVVDALDAQPSCILAGCLWLILLAGLIWLVTR